MDYKRIITRRFSAEDISNHMIYIKNKKGEYQYINDQVLYLMKTFNGNEFTWQDCQGRHDEDIYPASMIDEIIDFDNEVLSHSRTKQRDRHFKISTTQILEAVTYKEPLLQSGQVIGTISQTILLNHFHIDGHNILFNQRELDVLVFIIFGMPIKMAESRLYMSRSSVNEYQKRIRKKLNVTTNQEVIEFFLTTQATPYLLNHLMSIENRFQARQSL